MGAGEQQSLVGAEGLERARRKGAGLLQRVHRLQAETGQARQVGGRRHTLASQSCCSRGTPAGR